MNEKKKNRVRSLLWLLLIPGQIVLGRLFISFGTVIDEIIFSNPEAQGHGIPIFSVIFLIIAAVVTLIVFVLAIVLTIRGLKK